MQQGGLSLQPAPDPLSRHVQLASPSAGSPLGRGSAGRLQGLRRLGGTRSSVRLRCSGASPCALAHCRLHLEAGSDLRLAPGRLLWRHCRLAALARSGWRCRRRPLHEDHGVLPPLHHRRFLVDLLQRRHRNVGGHGAEGNGEQRRLVVRSLRLRLRSCRLRPGLGCYIGLLLRRLGGPSLRRLLLLPHLSCVLLRGLPEVGAGIHAARA